MKNDAINDFNNTVRAVFHDLDRVKAFVEEADPKITPNQDPGMGADDPWATLQRNLELLESLLDIETFSGRLASKRDREFAELEKIWTRGSNARVRMSAYFHRFKFGREHVCGHRCKDKQSCEGRDTTGVWKVSAQGDAACDCGPGHVSKERSGSGFFHVPVC